MNNICVVPGTRPHHSYVTPSAAVEPLCLVVSAIANSELIAKSKIRISTTMIHSQHPNSPYFIGQSANLALLNNQKDVE